MTEPQGEIPLYQLTLDQREFTLLLSLTYLGAQLVTHKVEESFNTLWGRAEYIIQLAPGSIASLVNKLHILDAEGQAQLNPNPPELS